MTTLPAAVRAIQTGLRVSELTGLRIADVTLGTGANVRVIGKGRKMRCTTLTPEIVTILRQWLQPFGAWECQQSISAGLSRHTCRARRCSGAPDSCTRCGEPRRSCSATGRSATGRCTPCVTSRAGAPSA
jgi:integrase